MDILLIGGEGALTGDLIDKFYKEKHRVFWLSGTDIRTKKNPKVTGQFDFRLTTDSLADVIVGISPDVIVYTGAYDTNFSWKNLQDDAKRYVSGITNLLLAASVVPNCRMIYLSSHEVFPLEEASVLTEDYRIPVPEKVDMETLKSRILIQAEEQWTNSRSVYGMDEVVLRLDHLYALPYEKQLFGDICNQMCYEAFQNGKIYVNPNHRFSLTYLSDATEAVYRMAFAEERKRNTYHVSSSDTYTELDIAKIVNECLRGKVDLLVDSIGRSHGRVLSGKVFDEEFDMRFHHRAEDIIPRIMDELRRHFTRYQSADDRKNGPFVGFFRFVEAVASSLIPILENIAVFIGVFALTKALSGNLKFSGFDFYLLYVLLFAGVYGQNQAILSSLLSVLGFFLQKESLDAVKAAAVDYSTYIWIAMIFITGLSVGFLKDRMINNRKEAEEEEAFLRERRDEIRQINNENVKVKKVLEQQLVNQRDSLGRLYKITSELNSVREEVVLFRAVEVVSEMMGTNEAALYMASGGAYIRLFAATSEKARSLGNSVKMDSLGDMIQALFNKEVFINSALDPNLPVLAQGIYDDDNLEMVFMLWDIPWERLTLAQSNMLTVTCLLIQDAVIRARRYLDILHEHQYIPGTAIFDKRSFGELIDMYVSAEKRGLIACCLIEVSVPGMTVEQIEKKFRHMIRQLDFLGGPGDGRVYILLTNTTREGGGDLVKNRIEGMGHTARIMEMEAYEA